MIAGSEKEKIVVEPPVKTKPEVSTDVLTSIQPGTLEDSFVYVHCHCQNPGDDLLIRIWRTTFLVDTESATKSQLIHAEQITMAPQWTLIPKGMAHTFLLIFGSLHASCKKFDLIEQIDQPGGFEVRSIVRNETDVYHIHLL